MNNMKVLLQPLQLNCHLAEPTHCKIMYKRMLISTNHEIEKY